MLGVLVLLLLSITATITGCDRASSNKIDKAQDLSTVGKKRHEKATLGYYDSTGKLNNVSVEQVRQYFIEEGVIDQAHQVAEFYVVDSLDAANKIVMSALIMRTSAGQEFATIRTSVYQYEPGVYAFSTSNMDNSTCSCKSTNCSTWGCNVSEFGPCSCSDCGRAEGKCEKTSSRKDLSAVESSFQSL